MTPTITASCTATVSEKSTTPTTTTGARPISTPVKRCTSIVNGPTDCCWAGTSIAATFTPPRTRSRSRRYRKTAFCPTRTCACNGCRTTMPPCRTSTSSRAPRMCISVSTPARFGRRHAVLRLRSQLDASGCRTAVRLSLRTHRCSLFLNSRLATRFEDGALHDAIATGVGRLLSRHQRPQPLAAALHRRCRPQPRRRSLRSSSAAITGCAAIRCATRTATSDALFTIEERLYTRYYLLRLFNVGGAAFFDMGRTWGYTPVPTPQSRPAQGCRRGPAARQCALIVRQRDPRRSGVAVRARASGISRVQFLISTAGRAY